MSEKVSLGGALKAAFGFWGRGVRATAGILAVASIAYAWLGFVWKQLLDKVVAAKAVIEAGGTPIDVSITLVALLTWLLCLYLAYSGLYRSAFSENKADSADMKPGPLGFQFGRLELAVIVAALLRVILVGFIFALFQVGFSALLIAVGVSMGKPFATPDAFVAALGPATPIVAGAALIAFVIYVWINVRLSLVEVASAAASRPQVLSSWPLTRGRFWLLLIGNIVLALSAIFLSLFMALSVGGVARLVTVKGFGADIDAVAMLLVSATFVFSYVPLTAGFNAYIYEQVGLTTPPESKTS